MDKAFQWNDSFSVKVNAMDDQHKKLFEITRELYSAMQSGQGKKVVGDVLQRLIDYTVHHFASEEALMEQNGYPDLAQHQAEHRALTDKVVAFQEKFNAGQAVITSELMTFLQEWLTGHIHNIDRRYGEFMNAKGSK